MMLILPRSSVPYRVLARFCEQRKVRNLAPSLVIQSPKPALQRTVRASDPDLAKRSQEIQQSKQAVRTYVAKNPCWSLIQRITEGKSLPSIQYSCLISAFFSSQSFADLGRYNDAAVADC